MSRVMPPTISMLRGRTTFLSMIPLEEGVAYQQLRGDDNDDELFATVRIQPETSRHQIRRSKEGDGKIMMMVFGVRQGRGCFLLLLLLLFLLLLPQSVSIVPYSILHPLPPRFLLWILLYGSCHRHCHRYIFFTILPSNANANANEEVTSRFRH